MTFPPLKLDALVIAIITLIGVIFIDMMLIVFVLSGLSGIISADLLNSILRIVVVLTMLLPAYVCARLAKQNPVYHALLIGVIEAATLALLMTFTFSWQGTLHDYVLSRIPLTIVITILLNLLVGYLVERVSRKKPAK